MGDFGMASFLSPFYLRINNLARLSNRGERCDLSAFTLWYEDADSKNSLRCDDAARTRFGRALTVAGFFFWSVT
jgi:hypothetical protein